MFFRLFNWLVRRTPYTFAFISRGFSWTVLVASFGALLVFIGADFEATGTREQFIQLFIASVGIASFLTFEEYGLLRLLFGFRWERPEFTVLNENIVEGHFRQGISNEELLRAYDSLRQIGRWTVFKNIQYGQIIAFAVTLGEWLFSGQLMNVPIIFLGVNIATCSLYIYGAVFYESITSPARRECKMLLADRRVHFEDSSFISLRIKSKFFIILIALALLAILILVKPLNPLLIVLSLITLVIIGLLNDLVFKSIYQEFTEIKESARNLAAGRKISFFSGSSDREILDLSQSLNETAREIREYEKALEKEKLSLEMKVRERTKDLEELNESLEGKVRERTTELQDKVDELEEYTSITSHDLQQPLAAIQAYTHISVQNAKVIESQADFMRDLLNDLLEYSRSKRRMSFEEVDVLEVLGDVRKTLSSEIEGKGAVFRYKDIPQSVFGQGKRITQLFCNLIGNALKYSNPDKKPIIEVGCKETESDFLFHVRDNGRGIPAEFHKKIFQPFWKLGKEPGTGMGLAICKAIVENQGGRIWVESVPWNGATFHFTIAKKH
jgi:signal transduction histidine kinase